MPAQPAIEREIKLGAGPGFTLPELNGTLDGATAATPAEQHLSAVYFDTPDLHLLRRGVTLRFRTGDEPDRLWTAKLPSEAEALGLARREISVQGGAHTIPPLLEDLVRGWALGAPLAPVARLRTRRRRTVVQAPDQHPLALIDDDEVSIVQGSRVVARFRELEVELADGAPNKLLGRLADQLRDAGAQPVDQVPKLVRALGPRALAPWELAQPELDPDPSAAEVLRAGLIANAARLIDHLAAVVLDEGVEGVHQARVGIRRLRSDLRSFRPLLDTTVIKPLRAELKWLGSEELGEMRDLDVLLGRLWEDAQSLDAADRLGAGQVLAGFEQRRQAAYERLRGALRTARCAALLEETVRVAITPPFVSERARRPARKVVPKLVRKPLRRLMRDGEQLGDDPSDAALHQIRIDAKRVRYASELAAPVIGKPAQRSARKLARMQDVLGEQHDAVTALARLRDVALEAPPETALAAGVLGGLQITRSADCRARFQGVWRKAVRHKRWRWLDGG